MTDRFDTCLPIILEAEGGYSDNPKDSGGTTNLGVTLNTLSGYLGRTATVADVKALTPATVAPLYRTHYWAAASCDQLPAGVDLIIFDSAVNMGVGTAVKFLQEAAGVRDMDGIAGPETIAAVTAYDAETLIAKTASLRVARYKSLPTFHTFGNGWLARVSHIEELSKGMIV